LSREDHITVPLECRCDRLHVRGCESVQQGRGITRSRRGLRTFSLSSPLNTNNRLVPTSFIDPVIDACAPLPTANMAITAATPITIPSTVRPERNLFR
jgi:hypothetical protein